MTTSNKKCMICKFDEDNVLDLGEKKTKEDCTIHLFCALLSTHSQQNGTDSQGIDGFLLDDLRKLRNGYSKTKCSYCRKTHATVYCKEKGCDRRFHVKCGVQRKCLFQFEGAHDSYCHQHVVIKEKCEIHADWWSCQICKEPMGEYNPITSIPSCCNQGFFHRTCAQRHARSAGYLAKCPCCGLKEDEDGMKYRELLRKRGIFCPDKDADWLTKDEDDEILRVYKNCDAKNCLCPKGPQHDEQDGQWRLLKCNDCGKWCMHEGCQSNNTDETFKCDACFVSYSLVATYTQSSSNIAERRNEFEIVEIDDEETEVEEEQENVSNGEPNGREENGLKWVKSEKLTFRQRTLVMADQNCDVDPLCDYERGKMRNSRLDMFFEKSDFNVKPPVTPWLI